MSDAHWEGPVTIGWLLDHSLDEAVLPPESHGVFVISRQPWSGHAAPESRPLLVGANRHAHGAFRRHVGDFIADAFGFFTRDESIGHGLGHSKGGRTLYRYCQREGITPDGLYIGWATNVGCARCAETVLYDALQPELQPMRAMRCHFHRDPAQAAFGSAASTAEMTAALLRPPL